MHSMNAMPVEQKKEPTRRGYSIEAIEVKSIYLRRAHPRDPVEVVIGYGDHHCTIVRLTKDQHRALTRDSHALWFTESVLA